MRNSGGASSRGLLSSNAEESKADIVFTNDNDCKFGNPTVAEKYRKLAPCECPEGQICDIEISCECGYGESADLVFKGTFRNVHISGRNAGKYLSGWPFGQRLKAANVLIEGDFAGSKAYGFILSGKFECRGTNACDYLGQDGSTRMVGGLAPFAVEAESALCDGKETCRRARSFNIRGKFVCKGHQGV
jgi:hypothetical protein